MTDHSLEPWFAVDVPDLDTLAWKKTVRLAWVRRGEIVDQRLKQSNEHGGDIWDLRDFEFRHFLSGWVGLAFRFRACAEHHHAFTASFDASGGDAADEALYREDEALFGFFVNGLAALECCFYSLYALGALVCTPAQTASTPPGPAFPLLDPHAPKKEKAITPRGTVNAFQNRFAGYPLTLHLERMLGDPAYRGWSDIRNVVAHRAGTAGRSFQYDSLDALLGGERTQPSAVTLWAGGINLTGNLTAVHYDWLRETLNLGLAATLAFAEHELPYPESRLPPL